VIFIACARSLAARCSNKQNRDAQLTSPIGENNSFIASNPQKICEIIDTAPATTATEITIVGEIENSSSESSVRSEKEELVTRPTVVEVNGAEESE